MQVEVTEKTLSDEQQKRTFFCRNMQELNLAVPSWLLFKKCSMRMKQDDILN